ncbi:hypothetical protein CPB86DRAFT_828676 [Serendipita vermifera]|nr:hypothetical protein CPB86DRAFT_828676 [Serendipita vermifera]
MFTFQPALFAGVPISLTQLAPIDDGGSPQEALRVFVLCSIIVDLLASWLSSCNSWMFSKIPRQAAMLILKDEGSLPYKVIVANQPLAPEIMSDRMQLLTKFGTNRPLVRTHKWSGWMSLFKNALMFTAFVIWVWAEQSRVVADDANSSHSRHYKFNGAINFYMTEIEMYNASKFSTLPPSTLFDNSHYYALPLTIMLISSLSLPLLDNRQHGNVPSKRKSRVMKYGKRETQELML